MPTDPIAILQVEDNFYDVECVELTLKRSHVNFRLTWRERGDQALQALKEEKFDIILLDHKLPMKSGIEIFREALALGIETPVIFLTGSGNERVAVEAIKLGAYDYLVKDSSGEYLHLLPALLEKTLLQHEEKVNRLCAENALAASEQRFRSLASHAPVGIFEMDQQGRLTFVNEHWTQLTGIAAADAMGRAWMDTLIPDDRDLAEVVWTSVALVHHDAKCECCLNSDLSEPLWVAMGVTPLFDESQNFRGALGTLVDLRERKRTEDQIKAYSRELETRTLELDTFVHALMHDLRNPLTAISLHLDLVMRSANEERSQKAKERIRTSVDRMNRMIDQLLAMAKMRETGEIELEAVNVGEVSQEVCSTLEPLIRERAISVEIAPDMPPVLGHAGWIFRILENLVGNAIKYMPADRENPRIIIRGLCRNDRVRIEVEDNGAGISGKDQERLFERFVRADRSENGSGFGLGLSIVRLLAQNMGGSVGLESEPGQGATFWFEVGCAGSEVADL